MAAECYTYNALYNSFFTWQLTDKTGTGCTRALSMCFKQVHVFNMLDMFNMFVLKGKSRLITDKNIFALCFKEYLKKRKKK